MRDSLWDAFGIPCDVVAPSGQGVKGDRLWDAEGIPCDVVASPG